jgi:hypothetical protein
LLLGFVPFETFYASVILIYEVREVSMSSICPRL